MLANDTDGNSLKAAPASDASSAKDGLRPGAGGGSAPPPPAAPESATAGEPAGPADADDQFDLEELLKSISDLHLFA